MKFTGTLTIFILTLLALAASAYAAEDSQLFEAIGKGDKAAVEALLAKGANVNAKTENGHTPLHRAASKDVAEMLIAKGANVNAKENNGATPLHFAVIGKNATKDIAELLLAKGADVNAKDINAQTPLHYTASKDIAEMLIAKGADINATNKFNETPLSRATSEGKKDVAELLEKFMLKQASRNPHEQLQQLIAQLKGSPYDTALREKLITFATSIKPAPAIPEEARRSFIIGEALFKQAKNLKPAYEAANAFWTAATLAPWWGNAYWNLAVAQQLAGQYASAKESLRLYLLTNPSPADRRTAQDRLYAIEADIIAATSIVPGGLAGFWQRSSYKSLTNGEWIKDDPESARIDAYDIQQTGATYGVKCMKCASDSQSKWTVNVISASNDAITFQKRMVSPWYDSGPENHECKLAGNTLSCTISRKGEENFSVRYVKRSVCEVVGGPGMEGYFVLCK